MDELEEQGAARFKFLSVVEFLRQSLPDRVQSVLGDDIFLHEATLWNQLVGPTFRCDLLVNTHCSDVADDACFSSRIVSWLDCVPRDNPLLVQPIDSDDSYSASLHRYSGVVHESKGVEGQCCIPNCTRIFPEEHTLRNLGQCVASIISAFVLQISAIELLRN